MDSDFINEWRKRLRLLTRKKPTSSEYEIMGRSLYKHINQKGKK